MPTETLRIAVDVVAGVLPGTPMPEYTRRYYITSSEWNAEDADKTELLTQLSGKATARATLLMLQPDMFNWVKLEWIYF